MRPLIRLVLSFALVLALPVGAASAPPVVTDLGLLPGDATVAAATNSQQDHSICRGGDRFLVVWSDYRGQAVGGGTNQSGGDIFGIRLDAQGAPLDPAPFLIAGGMGLQRRPLVAWNGTAWLVLYVSQDPVGGYFDDVIRAVRVSGAGAVLDPVPMALPATQYMPNTVGLQLVGMGGQWLVTRCIYHADGYGTYLAGQRIGGDGALLDVTPVMLLDWVYGGTVSLTANGEYLVAGPDWNGTTPKAQRVGADGRPLGASFTLPSLQLASDGAEYYVVWVKDYVNLVGSRMTPTGTLLNPTGTTLVAGFAQYSQSTLTHDGTRWWFEWGVSDQLHTVRIDASGAVLDAGGGPLLPIAIGGNVNNAYDVKLAPRPGGGVLVTWYDLRVALGYDTNVFVLPVSAANTAGVERCVSTGTRNQRSPDLAAGPGGEVALVYVSEAANDRRVMLRLLDHDGNPTTAEPLEVASAPSIGRASVAWNGSHYLVSWDGGVTGDPLQTVEARRMAADGSPVDAAPFDVMPGFAPDVEALGDDFLIACSRYGTYPQNIFAVMRILDGPTRMFTIPATFIGGNYVAVGPNVHQDGTRWVVTYETRWTHDSSQSDALYQFVNADGSFTAASNPSIYSGSAGTPDVAFSGSRYLFVWRSNSLSNANNYIVGRLMDTDGRFATSVFVIAEAAGRQLRPVVGWNGAEFVVAWDDQRAQQAFFDERTDVYGARVSADGLVMDAAGFVIHAGPQGDANAALLTRPDGHALVAEARFVADGTYDSYRIGLTYVGESRALDVAPAAPALAMGVPVPNPMRADMRIVLSLPRAERVSVTVLDPQGRRVRTLVDGRELAAGTRDVTWDGRDESGARVAPGVYLVELRTPSAVRARRVAVLGR